ncbi:hypothetical protein RRG08_025626 [Elysia crispata]|uniref:Uncharacterized protein n=1 Tax=Elysia crispata TaxID=231223 RepID=A0AAE0YE17_9GAST|nr:hypothetical protein RRG08_025626 [Elysia crispata]
MQRTKTSVKPVRPSSNQLVLEQHNISWSRFNANTTQLVCRCQRPNASGSSRGFRAYLARLDFGAGPMVNERIRAEGPGTGNLKRVDLIAACKHC